MLSRWKTGSGPRIEAEESLSWLMKAPKGIVAAAILEAESYGHEGKTGEC